MGDLSNVTLSKVGMSKVGKRAKCVMEVEYPMQFQMARTEGRIEIEYVINRHAVFNWGKLGVQWNLVHVLTDHLIRTQLLQRYDMQRREYGA